MSGEPIKKTKKRQSLPKKSKERRATTKTKAQREAEFIAACRRSSFEGFDLVQILTDFYGWQKVTIASAPGITEHTMTNAWSQSKAEQKYRTSHGSP